MASNPDIARGAMYGILKNQNGRVKISSQIFESYIYEYFKSSRKDCLFPYKGYKIFEVVVAYRDKG